MGLWRRQVLTLTITLQKTDESRWPTFPCLIPSIPNLPWGERKGSPGKGRNPWGGSVMLEEALNINREWSKKNNNRGAGRTPPPSPQPLWRSSNINHEDKYYRGNTALGERWWWKAPKCIWQGVNIELKDKQGERLLLFMPMGRQGKVIDGQHPLSVWSSHRRAASDARWTPGRGEFTHLRGFKLFYCA